MQHNDQKITVCKGFLLTMLLVIDVCEAMVNVASNIGTAGM